MDKKKKYILTGMLLLLSVVSTAPGNVSEAKTKLSLNKKKVTLAVGKTAKLRLQNAKKKVKWTSSSKKVASVSSRGIVRARKKGRAKITAKAGKRKFVCRVYVVNKSTKKVSSTEASTPDSTSASTATLLQSGNKAEQVLELVNQERAKKGRDPLTLDKSLCAAANERAKEITSLFSHIRPDGTDCFSIFEEYGISYMRAGENIAGGQSTPAAVMNSWMNSQGHRENILSSEFTKLGVGCVNAGSGYGYYWVQMFTD